MNCFGGDGEGGVEINHTILPGGTLIEAGMSWNLCKLGSLCKQQVIVTDANLFQTITEPYDMTGGVCTDFIKQNASCHMQGFTSCGCEPGNKHHYVQKTVAFAN